MKRKVHVIPNQEVEQVESVNEIPQGVEWIQALKIGDKEILTQELDTAKAAYLEYSNNQPYYEEDRDKEIKQTYYKNELDRNELQELLEKTHRNKLNYTPHRYVYPWVDLQENGKLKSIYSGKEMDPLAVMEEDIRILEDRRVNLTSLSDDMKLNCEHVVPQSWFDEREPMRGDLHHLFACDPTCNSRRGNSPYEDFPDYVPESLTLGIAEGCGKADEGKFEPEFGKGIVARATFYFITRYPGVINNNLVNLKLLLNWHQQFPVSIYEKHRNLAIYELQGNRNPFIDFPELAEKWLIK
ncbi:endonuclease I family protein [Robertmurraya kyonggiensis]|uniref:Endonuclease I n=1 Tax=Robertmurraya kyonggiensis TaxID=1037680 RepID=A0A4U1D2V7_9BACI|nr:endonuclease [Robertmurraya kyonggiensis]TKC16725.1 endonuclease I [Robertmurraya kyonggiensis]